MKFYLGVTDNNWYNYLSRINPEDINFWQPGGKMSFKVLENGAPFLFKLKYPTNVIAGIGFFSSHTFLPINIAWDVFGNRNGCDTFIEFQNLISKYRVEKLSINPTIGCIVLTNPIFFKKDDWIEVPPDWSKSIVQGKSYDTNTSIGQELWIKIENLLERYLKPIQAVDYESQLIQEPEAMYGKSILTRVRLGQGAFRVLVTDAYTRRCSITGEKTLPVLEAAHIKPYALAGPHAISNGLLLRSDVHKLFDTGYLTVTNNLKIEVSKRIKEEFENGKEYYQFHGKELLYLPKQDREKPRTEFIQWHNENVYKG
ncbi:MAG TPA: HNH endonuclease [Chitinophagaceae bacterium]|nr:HNH endonuclease [Chitinophagaceae bacterium]